MAGMMTRKDVFPARGLPNVRVIGSVPEGDR